MPRHALVTGAGGFIGHHLVKYLAARGYYVRGVDTKKPEFEPTAAHEFELLDLRRFANCLVATRDVDEVYNLAADGVKRFLFSLSACVYPQHLQRSPEVAPLREQDAWPADPEEGYGLEKLFMEKLCQYFCEDHGWRRASYGFTMSTAHWELTKAGRKRPRLLFPARWRWLTTRTRSRSGATARKPARSCT